MKNIFLLFLVLVFAHITAQENALKCVRNTQKAAHTVRPTLMKNAVTIKIVSYSWRHNSDEMVGVIDSVFAKKLPLETAYKEVKTLDAKTKAQLLDLLFGYLIEATNAVQLTARAGIIPRITYFRKSSSSHLKFWINSEKL